MGKPTLHTWATAQNDGAGVLLSAVPRLNYGDFCADMCTLLADETNRCVAYFAVPDGDGLGCYALVARDSAGDVLVGSHRVEYGDGGGYGSGLESLAARVPALHVFEREITELHGLRFLGAPWDKPLRYPFNRFRPEERIDNYPFYDMAGPDLHHVQVGPVHAGIIEPGAFRFLCDGERILHLEIALGYQHRGVEALMAETDNRLRQIVISESIAGDTALGHAIAAAHILESGNPKGRNGIVQCERAVALELERVAMHLADTGALCMDMAYQTGQVACEALRTLVINALQEWCGNRFGKGLIRPFGSYYRLDLERIKRIESILREVRGRYRNVGRNLLSTPTVLARMEGVCAVSRAQAMRVGAVGMAARTSGLSRDARLWHPFHPLPILPSGAAFEPTVLPEGDLLARLKLRLREVEASCVLIAACCKELTGRWFEGYQEPIYNKPLRKNALLFSLVEGWRGEICHVATTNVAGNVQVYKIVDPSVHNWLLLALSVRGEQISDFPLSNKSFNLSYCGHDL